jgi:two-component system sensor histidine kinase KdpD
VFDSQVAVFVADINKRLVLQLDEQLFFELDPKESGVVQWVFDHGERAGLNSDTLPGSSALYLPLVGSKGPIGVLAVRPTLATRFLDPEQLHLLEILANQTALALERARLAEEAQQAHISVETERMRNAILSSVSHDLRTPLATITGAASGLLEEKDQIGPAARHELAKSIYHEAQRLDHLVRNLLDMTRLESGAVHLQKEWHPFEEIVGAALIRLEGRLNAHHVQTNFHPDLPLVLVDGVLMEQVMINLLVNAIEAVKDKENPQITLSAYVANNRKTVIKISDNGNGMPPEVVDKIFVPFFSTKKSGSGIGLSLCKQIMMLHKGTIQVQSIEGQGTAFLLQF